MPRIPLLQFNPVQYRRGNQERLQALFDFVQPCVACPRMEGRRRVLSPKNGRAGVKVLFFAEAPGRYGADRTGVPIHGDPTGNTFERLLRSIGWKRKDVFVTNAVLCNPRKADGTNDTPTNQEILNCSFHLDQTIRLVDPKVVVPIGQKALTALGILDVTLRKLELRSNVAKPFTWNGRLVFPVYHMSPKALFHRMYSQQARDFQQLKELVERLE